MPIKAYPQVRLTVYENINDYFDIPNSPSSPPPNPPPPSPLPPPYSPLDYLAPAPPPMSPPNAWDTSYTLPEIKTSGCGQSDSDAYSQCDEGKTFGIASSNTSRCEVSTDMRFPVSAIMNQTIYPQCVSIACSCRDQLVGFAIFDNIPLDSNYQNYCIVYGVSILTTCSFAFITTQGAPQEQYACPNSEPQGISFSENCLIWYDLFERGNALDARLQMYHLDFDSTSNPSAIDMYLSDCIGLNCNTNFLFQANERCQNSSWIKWVLFQTLLRPAQRYLILKKRENDNGCVTQTVAHEFNLRYIMFSQYTGD